MPASREMKKRYYDARHNCWCYLLREGAGALLRTTGSPRGRRASPCSTCSSGEEVTNVCCVVTRYFGGILLGAGGLVRAYTQSAKDALDAAGISVVRRWVETLVPCPYSLLERLKGRRPPPGGIVGGDGYGADVTLTVLLPEEKGRHIWHTSWT